MRRGAATAASSHGEVGEARGVTVQYPPTMLVVAKSMTRGVLSRQRQARPCCSQQGNCKNGLAQDFAGLKEPRWLEPVRSAQELWWSR